MRHPTPNPERCSASRLGRGFRTDPGGRVPAGKQKECSMKKTLQTALGMAGALSLAAALATPVAAAPLSGNAAVTTNYVFRGISQSAGQAAVQAGLDYDLGDVV